MALGRLGGRKGGPARARKLSAARRKEIACRAALYDLFHVVAKYSREVVEVAEVARREDVVVERLLP